MLIIHTQGEAGGRTVGHLQCPHCGHSARSHAQQLTHMAASHPTSLDSMSVGRLGKVLMYQSSGRLFHCYICFYTSRDFSQVFKHIITKHCMTKREEAEEGGVGGEGRNEGSEKGEEEKEMEKDAPEKKSSNVEADNEEVKDMAKRKEEEEGGDGGKGRNDESKKAEEEVEKDAPDKRSSNVVEANNEEVKDMAKREQAEEGGDGGKDRNDESKKAEEEVEKDAPDKRSSNVEEVNNEEAKDMVKREEAEEGGDGEDRSKKGEEELEKDAPEKRSSDVEAANNEEAKDTLKRKRSSEDEEEQNEESASVKPQDEKKNALKFDGLTYCCLICGWRTKKKSASVSHLVRKHDLHKTYAAQVIRRDVASISQKQGGGAEDEEAPGLSTELLKAEIEATTKVISYVGSRYVCHICGWRTKIKGFALSHVVRYHDVKCPYRCKECGQSFFLPSQLQHHIRVMHRPGRFACPFCWFRSEYLGGFQRHCSGCSTREEERGKGTGGGEEENEHEEEPREKEAWKQGSSERSIKVEQDDENNG